ncbi:hypothetical protein LZ31DRAFT_603739 [Colletotrichum somersetense]|nr:hypothetical protein LZ31DRAFT_603739 [Colletotrichum somersetense]
MTPNIFRIFNPEGQKEDAADKRRKQLRNAQRSYRDRKDSRHGVRSIIYPSYLHTKTHHPTCFNVYWIFQQTYARTESLHQRKHGTTFEVARNSAELKYKDSGDLLRS